MGAPSRDYAEIVPHLVRLAAEAGRLILSLSEGGLEVRSKDDKSPVTNADLRAEEMLLAGLAGVLPGVPVLAEEQAADGNVPEIGSAFLVLDPLDGTKEYLAGRAEYTVNIGLVENGRPTVGILSVPALGRTYWGVVGAGAARAVHPPGFLPAGDDFARIETRPLATPPLALTSRGHNDEKTEAFLDRLGAKERQRLGSAYKFALVAEGSADVYARFVGTMEWDTAAGEALLTAAGGGVRDPEGHLLAYGKSQTRFLNGPFVAWGRLPQA
jgi:3'(2'), 5'-bisphosphate nucleotidase